MLSKFHYGNCKADFADLTHQHEKLKTKTAALKQTLRDNEQIIRELNTELNELKAIHHYERAQLEAELKKTKTCDQSHQITELKKELKNLKVAYSDCLGDKQACKAELLQLKHDLQYDQSITKIPLSEPSKSEIVIDADTGEYREEKHAKKPKKPAKKTKKRSPSGKSCKP